MDNTEPQFSTYNTIKRIRDAIYQLIGIICGLLRLPGFVRSIEYADKVTGDYVRIRIGRRYTIVSVSDRDYWFNRLTGRFSGTGYSCCNLNEESPDCMLPGSSLSDFS